MDLSNTQFKLYANGDEYLGMAQVTLPTLNWLSNTISGSGIAGNIDSVIPGHVDTMSITINFRTTTRDSVKLSAPGRHTIELRVDQLTEDPVSGTLKHILEKHTMVIIPKTHNFGTIQPASPSDGSGEYSVRYWKVALDGKVVQEIDPFNHICNIDGTDYLADVRKNLG